VPEFLLHKTQGLELRQIVQKVEARIETIHKHEFA
jgi:hypothetical protein